MRRVRYYRMLLACVLGPALWTCSGDASEPNAALIGQYRLIRVNNTGLPVTFYTDPGGTFYAIADSGRLDIYSSDSLSSTRLLTVVYTPGGPVPASSYELIRYVRIDNRLILYHDLTPDTAVIDGTIITAHRRSSSQDQGYWQYVKQ